MGKTGFPPRVSIATCAADGLRSYDSVRHFVLTSMAVALLAASPWMLSRVHAADARDPEADLKALRARIESAKKNIEADTQRRDALSGELKSADLGIQSARAQSADIRQQVLASERRLDELSREQAETERQIAAQRAALSNEVRLAYMNGSEEQLKLLLNQRDPNELGRMLAYYAYFGRARAARIAEISERLEHLRVLTEDIAAERDRLRKIEAQSQAQLQQLAQARARRAKTLATIQSSLKTNADRLSAMQRQAATLEKLLDEIRNAARDFPILSSQPFAKVQGKLPWPVKGKIVARFGQPRSGGPLKWQGVVIGAEPGSQVRAPFHGRVVYADWLSGLGLLVVLDHGDGYLSLYGHNEQLYRKVGDIVAPGDALGSLGDGKPELYVEIRKGKQPLDPQRWLKK